MFRVQIPALARFMAGGYGPAVHRSRPRLLKRQARVKLVAATISFLLCSRWAHRASGTTAAGAPPQSRGELRSLRIVPSEVSLRGAGSSQRFLVLGHFSDGMERDLTIQARFSLSPPEKARVDSAGRVTALKDGSLILGASVAGHGAQARLEITGAAQKPPFRFAREMGRILTKRGCNGSDCHGGVKR